MDEREPVCTRLYVDYVEVHDRLPFSFLPIRGSFFVQTNCTRKFVSVVVPVRTEFLPEREQKHDSFSFLRYD